MGVFDSLALQGETQRTELRSALQLPFPAFLRNWDVPCTQGEAGVGNIYRSLHREILQVLAAAPEWDIPCHTSFAEGQSCGGPSSLLGSLEEGSLQAGLHRGHSLMAKKPNFTHVKASHKPVGLHLCFFSKEQLHLAMTTNAFCIVAGCEV